MYCESLSVPRGRNQLTIRYKVFPASSVSTRMSLHRKARSLRPLLALKSRPSLNSLRGPMSRVGADKSRRLIIIIVQVDIPGGSVIKDSPLPNPKILRNIFKSLSTFLISNRFVDAIEDPFCDVDRLSDSRSFCWIL